MMGDSLIPSEYGFLAPFWLNIFENPAAIQFNHRWLAVLTFIAIVALWLRARQARLNKAAHAAVTTMLAIACIQVGLGISVLLTNVPIPPGGRASGGSGGIAVERNRSRFFCAGPFL